MGIELETVIVKKLYEGMFLFDSAQAAGDWDGTLNEVKRILDRAGAEIVSMKKWDDRKLAYDIDRKSRGTYILCYFKVEGKKMSDIERDARLSDIIVRSLMLSTEDMSEEDIARATPDEAGKIAEEKAAERAEARAAEEAEKAEAEEAKKAEEAEVKEEPTEETKEEAVTEETPEEDTEEK